MKNTSVANNGCKDVKCVNSILMYFLLPHFHNKKTVMVSYRISPCSWNLSRIDACWGDAWSLDLSMFSNCLTLSISISPSSLQLERVWYTEAMYTFERSLCDSASPLMEIITRRAGQDTNSWMGHLRISEPIFEFRRLCTYFFHLFILHSVYESVVHLLCGNEVTPKGPWYLKYPEYQQKYSEDLYMNNIPTHIHTHT